MLSDAATAVRVHEALGRAGVGTAYWYRNNFHYIRNWQHLKALKSPYRLTIDLLENVPDYGEIRLPGTDDIMSRMQMFETRLSWTEVDLDEMRQKIETVLRDVL